MFSIVLIIFSFIIRISKTDISVGSDPKHLTEDKHLIGRIAIIGGGVGGSSAAYFLNDLVQNENSIDISIDLFEKNEELGGRLATKAMNGKQYETGGSIIHERNEYALHLVNQLKLSKRESVVTDSDKLCIYNGKSYVFCESSWQWITYLKIWLRYGFEVKRLQSKVSQIIDRFENIYKLQDHYVKFDSVDDLLDSMSPTINNLTKTRYNDFLSDSGFSKKLITELVQSITLVNYGQDVSIPAFVGMVSFAGAGSHLWSIKDGNKQLPKKLAQNSNANILLETYVSAVKYLGPNLFEVIAKTKSGQILTQIYNSVIIATPLTENQINFINFSVNLNQNIPIRKYQRTVSTLVSGTVSKKFKGRDVLTDNKSVFFTSLSRVHPVDESDDEKTPVYKVFSQSPLSREQLNTIFSDIETVQITDWFAYPKYDSITYPLPKFILFPGVYSLNAIEWAASAIEMSLIGGKNTALLVYNQLGGKTSSLNSEKIITNHILDEL